MKQPPKTNQHTAGQSANKTYQPGEIIGQRYEVHKVLGTGGFGVVYLVYDHQTKEIYALKTFHDKFLTDLNTRELFRKEANTLINMGDHPHLVKLHFVDEFSGRLFIAMEYIAENEQGINSLRGFLQGHPPKLSYCLHWAIEICFGIEYAYVKGVRAHRDLKPDNIMINQNGMAKITDFGLAGRLDALPSESVNPLSNTELLGATQKGVGVGTPTHMSPEQFENAASCDARSDIYALGIILFQMVTGGKLPFLTSLPKDNSEEEMMRFFYEMQELHNNAIVPYLDSPVFPIIKHCLAKAPAKRYQNFSQLRSDLELCLKEQTGEVIKPPQLSKTDYSDWNNKGTSFAALGYHEQAIDCFTHALENKPSDAGIWYNKGRSLSFLNQFSEANLCYDVSLGLNPQFYPALTNKGICLDSMGYYTEALIYYDKALAIDPHYAVSWNNKGNSLYKLNRYEEALHCYDKALKNDPQDIFAWNNKGLCFSKLGLYEEAIYCANKALEINPFYIDAWNDKGHYLCFLERLVDGIECFDKALEINPNHTNIWYIKAATEDEIGRVLNAIQSYQKFIDLASTQNKVEISWVHHALQRLEELENK